MGLNNAIKAVQSTIEIEESAIEIEESAIEATLTAVDKEIRFTRHELDKILEALPNLVKYKQHRLKVLAEEYRLQRATLGQEINDINRLIKKIRERL